MSHTTNESEHGKLSRNQSGLSLTDEENSGEIIGCGGTVLKKGPWTAAEDSILVEYVKKYGEGNWNAVQKHSGLSRCGKSCRLRWANHLRPNLKKGSFTSDEERLIIELHSKMGNKWARMAAHLPGRTDNEIKNYWNTRIKRLHRSGVPLYPPEVFLQAYADNQSQNTDGFYSGDKRHNGISQLNSFGLPRDISTDSYCSFMPPTIQGQKRFRNSMDMFSSHEGNSCNSLQQFNRCLDDPFYKVEQSCWLSFPYDPDDPSAKYQFSFGEMQGVHSLNNGNISASKPTSEAVKSELPSLQYPVTDFGYCGTFFLPAPLLESVDTDTFLRSPRSMGTMKSEISPPRNNGLLEAVLDESKTLGGEKKPSSNKSSGASVLTPCDLSHSSALTLSETEWEEYAESFSALGHSAGTSFIFNDCNSSGGGTSFPADVIPGKIVKLEPVDQLWEPYAEKEILTRSSRPDALFGSDCLQPHAVNKRQAVMTDPIAMLLGRDCESEYKYLSSETCTLSQDHEWDIGYCAWNNMPAAYQMFELP